MKNSERRSSSSSKKRRSVPTGHASVKRKVTRGNKARKAKTRKAIGAHVRRMRIKSQMKAKTRR
jgi:hypothetical protein